MPSKINTDPSPMLKNREKVSMPCVIHVQKPRKLKYALRGYSEFNNALYLDAFYIDIAQVLHVGAEIT